MTNKINHGLDCRTAVSKSVSIIDNNLILQILEGKTKSVDGREGLLVLLASMGARIRVGEPMILRYVEYSNYDLLLH